MITHTVFPLIAEDFEPDDEAKPRRFLTCAEIESLPKPEYLLDGILPVGSLGVLYGAPGSFKSFLALDWCLSVATGFRWQDREVLQGPVLYVAGEGSSGMGARVRAWKEYREFVGEPPLQFLTSPPLLTSRDAALQLIVDMAVEIADKPALIVIDTLSRDLAGADENSQADMSNYISNVDHVRRVTGATVLLVHHTNASAERERGSTVLRGAADTMVQIKNDDGVIVLSCEKQKDDFPFSKIQLQAMSVGESAVLTANYALQLPTAVASEKELQALRSLQELSPPSGLSATRWLELSELKERTFYASLKTLCDKELVKADREGRGALYRITPAGEDLLTANCKVTANSLQCSNGNSLHATRGVLEPRSNAVTAADDDYEEWEQGRAAL